MRHRPPADNSSTIGIAFGDKFYKRPGRHSAAPAHPLPRSALTRAKNGSAEWCGGGASANSTTVERGETVK